MYQTIVRSSRNIVEYLRIGLIMLGVAVVVFLFFGGETVLGLKPNPTHLIIYAYSSQEEVLTQGIIPAFERAWESENGEELEIDAVFGPSGTLARQDSLVGSADIAIFSNSRHVEWLKKRGVVQLETKPISIGFSPMVIVTRQNNPKNITGFNDLTQPGLSLVHADPHSSGAGEWSLLAEYYSAIMETNDPLVAGDSLKMIWGNSVSLGCSARTSLSLFESGPADALITYEQDALFAQERGVPLEIIIPSYTIVAQNAAVILDKNVTPIEREAVQAFLDYMMSAEGQQIFSNYHLRPAIHLQNNSTHESHFITIEDLGGWSYAYSNTVEPIWLADLEPQLEFCP